MAGDELRQRFQTLEAEVLPLADCPQNLPWSFCSRALSVAMPRGTNSSAPAKARVGWPAASATIADSRWELALLAKRSPGG